MAAAAVATPNSSAKCFVINDHFPVLMGRSCFDGSRDLGHGERLRIGSSLTEC